MEVILGTFDFVVHLDEHLRELVQNAGLWAYLLLFLVIFCETGLVVTPFLPGDSFLFLTGAICASGELNVVFVAILLTLASIIGDTTNYQIGKLTKHKIEKMKNVPLLKREHLVKTQKFFEKHGGKAIIIGKFIPIIRTFTPFVAGAGAMNYPRFICYNILGGVLWINLFVFGGYFFGNLDWVKDNFLIVIVAIILVSLAPGLVAVINNKIEKRKNEGIVKNDN